MNSYYIIRHGEVDGKGSCIGKTDKPLTEKGIIDVTFRGKEIASFPDSDYYSSPLSRCLNTAELCGVDSQKLIILRELSEIDMGKWDGLSFDAIKQKWPALYSQRGNDIVHTAAPDGESFAECRVRAEKAIEKINNTSHKSNHLIFSHSGMGKMLLSALCDIVMEDSLRESLPYFSAFQVLKTNKGKCYFKADREIKVVPNEAEIYRAYEHFSTPQNVIEHCNAVCDKAMEICDMLEMRSIFLNRQFIRIACLTHDAARINSGHAELMADYLLKESYAALAATVGDHMVLPASDERISEKSVVFLADKLVQGTKAVSLEERYNADKHPEKAKFIKERYNQARRVYKLIFLS